MKRFQRKLAKDKSAVIEKMGASSVHKVLKLSEITPDPNLSDYEGLFEKEYPVWMELGLQHEFLFLHKVELVNFGFVHPERPGGLTKNRQGQGLPSSVKFVLQTIDHFEPRVFLRGVLYGSSADMHDAVGFDLLVHGCAFEDESPLGFAAEAIAEAYAFEHSGRYKQAFFHYFTALDSFIDSHRKKLSLSLDEKDRLEPNIRLDEKLSAIVKAKLSPGKKLGEVKFWGSTMGTFKRMVGLRNNIAHNVDHEWIEASQVNECFSVLALVVAAVEFGLDDIGSIQNHYGI